ncbi:hypothetical protein TSUD_403430 [Trifolium subterraneum]|uniref:Reverse transcriptase domain-containing protein n=1 Tax=Trifolium subterraneum TaxID=3900 RepID=A0A2Z6PB91_TRISU|nr:hypothetical protein TSUD_403430 [Trifolium subterraneum]
MVFLAEFHKNVVLPKAITTSFLALIPKKDHPQVLSDYRPICLVSSLYKILSKVLAARLKNVMGKLISEVQSTFLPNRQILDGVLVVNELLDLAKRRKDKCLFFKVDFERAYNTVNWNFLDYMMARMGFAEGWRRWICACVFQSSMYVLVNGSTTEDFIVGKGLRQGDPLSPFLFLIVAEGLTGLMRTAVDNGMFQGYKVGNNISFNTFQFADDTIFVGEGNWENIWTIKTVLRSFEIVSGLKVNFYKSKLYGVNIEDYFLRASSAYLNCEVDSIPFRFLGLPVGANPRRRAIWLPILDSMRKRLCAWNGRNLSIGGTEDLKNASIWWRDIWRLGGMGEGNWFGNNVSSVLGDGNDIGFWKEKWMGLEPFRILYPSLYAKTTQPQALVSTMGTWDNNSCSWKLDWTAPLTAMEKVDVAELQLLLAQVQPRRDSNDRCRWIPNTMGLFTVQSAYTALLTRINSPVLE